MSFRQDQGMQRVTEGLQYTDQESPTLIAGVCIDRALLEWFKVLEALTVSIVIWMMRAIWKFRPRYQNLTFLNSQFQYMVLYSPLCAEAHGTSFTQKPSA